MFKTNISSNFLSLCATFYLNRSEFGMTCMKYVQNTFLE